MATIRESNRVSVPALRTAAGSVLGLAAIGFALSGGGKELITGEGARYLGGLAGLCAPMLLFSLMLLASRLPARYAASEGGGSRAYLAWRAASFALHAWAIAIGFASLALTLGLQPLSDSLGWTGVVDGDFPRVIINDFQESAQQAIFILVLYYARALVLSRRSARSA